MAEAYLYDIPAKTGSDLGFPGSSPAAMLQTMPATLITGGGRSLIRYDPVEKMLYRISSNGKWYRADGGSRRAAPSPARLVPVPRELTAKAQKAVAAVQALSISMDKALRR
jgi:hypothetical protein